MRQSMICRTLLATALSLSVLSAVGRAGEPHPMMPESGYPVEQISEGHADAVPRRCLLGRLRPIAIYQRVQSARPLGCYGNFNDYSCGSLNSECRFLFSSCRGFYGERCLKGPPPSPVPGFDPYALGVDRRGNGRCPGCR